MRLKHLTDSETRRAAAGSMALCVCISTELARAMPSTEDLAHLSLISQHLVTYMWTPLLMATLFSAWMSFCLILMPWLRKLLVQL